MEHMIIGTAGHIDHGKTALIRALTGRETDTLKEEKKRGISIDLGFTYFDLPDGNRAGIIDVPGHEKFLPNMLAGVCGMDLVLLVIALDEGMMPQTREHMEILRQLGVVKGIIVLTKADLVDAEWAKMMEEDIQKELSGTVFEDWPRIPVSAVTGDGIHRLKDQMQRMLVNTEHNRNISGRFRLPIDRTMSLKGLGTVVAGTLMEGIVHVDEEVMLYPSLETSKIRSIQVHGCDVDKAYAGQRAAILLAGIKKEEVKRGFVAAYPQSLRLSDRLDVILHMSGQTQRALKNQSRLHLHIGTKELLCRAVLLEKDELAPGESGYAQLVLEEAVAVRKHDRFVLRFYSPLETIGGGCVLDECAKKHRRKDAAVLEYLKNKEENRDEVILMSLLGQAEHPLNTKELEEQAKLLPEVLNRYLEVFEQEHGCVVIRGKKRLYFWSFEAEDGARAQLGHFLKQYHRQHPYRNGADKAMIKSSCFRRWEPDRFDAYVEYLIEEQYLKGTGARFWMSDFTVVRDVRIEQLLQQCRKTFAEAGCNFTDIRELQPKDMDPEMFSDALLYLSKEGELVRISDSFYTTPVIAEEIIAKVQDYFEQEEILSFASLRDMLGTSRRSAKPIMAYLDEQKITAWCNKETERKKYKG